MCIESFTWFGIHKLRCNLNKRVGAAANFFDYSQRPIVALQQHLPDEGEWTILGQFLHECARLIFEYGFRALFLFLLLNIITRCNPVLIHR